MLMASLTTPRKENGDRDQGEGMPALRGHWRTIWLVSSLLLAIVPYI